jgi:hypothetical protein
MSLADPPSARRVPVHRRSIDIEAFDAPDHLELVCHFRDERPWATGTPLHVIHEMALEIDVRKDDLVIIRSEARMIAVPARRVPRHHAEVR